MLRVFLSAAPSPDRADAWVRYAADGRPIGRGRDVPGRWPADPDVEVVLAAEQVRLAAPDLPPMPRNRLRPAVQYALEDQMATAPDESTIAIADRGPPVIAAIASAALIRAIAGQARVTRIIPESALAPHRDGWTWCRSAAGGGFVRRADGSAFAVGNGSGGALPPELGAALAQARRAGAAPTVVHAGVPADAAMLAEWSRSADVPFVAASEWQWQDASPEAFTAAPDFLARDGNTQATAADSRIGRVFRPALILTAAALALHVGALLVQWSWLNLVDWRLARALVAHAAAAGLPNAGTPAAASTLLAQRNAELRHRAGKSAPGDAVPLLARAAPSIAALPKGMLKSATYVNDAWTIEFGKLDADALSDVTRALHRAGVDAVAAPTAGGTRMRLTLDAGAR